MGKSYRVAVIGCGGRSNPHIDAYQHIPNAKVVACCDINPAKLKERAEKYKLTPYDDTAKMIQAEKPDLVHITTPPTARVNLLTLISDLGVPAATIEKPLCVAVKDWRMLCDLAARTKTKIAVCHQFRWHEDFVKCREAVASGKLGSVRFLDFSAGMNISGQGTHILDYAMALNGDSPVVRVFGNASGAEDPDTAHPAPQTTEGYLTFANGARGLWNNGSTAPWNCGDPKQCWQHVRAGAYCGKGRVEWQEFANWEIVSPDGVQKGRFDDGDEWMVKNIRAQAAFHKAMLAWIEDDTRPAGTNFKQSLHEWQVVLALYASALWRKPIDLASFNPPDDLFDQLLTALGRK